MTFARRRATPPERGRYPGFAPGTFHEDGLRIDRDVAVPMRDGTTIYADVYRPAEQVEPAPVLIAWGPYGKHGGPARDKVFFPVSGVDPAWGVSRHAPTEAPDARFWCPHGYAVIHPDPRGTWGSEGDYTMGTRQEAEDFHDLIEWAGTREWANGKVGTTGVSYLAIAQWRVAATRPPHLAAINPWEGLNDFYRELGHQGGIPDTRFIRMMGDVATGYGHNKVEDMVALFGEHPLRDGYWTAKDTDLHAVDVPAYVVASWGSQGLHLRGTLEAYKSLPDGAKWLEVHGRKIFRHYYHPDSLANQRRFFDWALKDIDNGWEERPRVVLDVRERAATYVVRAEDEWPLARTEHTALHLDAATGTLSDEPPAAAARVAYDATVAPGAAPAHATFEHVFARPTELTGHLKLRLWLEIDAGDDADVFVGVFKRDAAGALVGFGSVPGFPGFPVEEAEREQGPAALGWLRASHRELDPERSTPQQPVHPHTREEPLTPGVPVALEVELWPTSVRFAAGERLALVVQGADLYHENPRREFGHEATRNAGRHTILTGEEHDSQLLVPVVGDRATG